MPKRIVGSVHWIENGKQTGRLVDVREAFSDPAQARDQVLFAEASGHREQIRLVRLAYHQFQGMRYRGENIAKPKRASKVSQKKLPKTGKSLNAKAGRKTAKKIAKRKGTDGKPVHIVNGQRFLRKECFDLLR
jgi:hypothetical protein